MEIMENYLTTEVISGLMDIFVTAPPSQGMFPVVIVFQEAFGVNNHIKNVCRRLSNKGYMAVAPELFHREGRHVLVDYADRKAFLPLLGNLNNDELIEDVKDTLNFLVELPNADTSKVFTLGFCMGGFTSILCSTRLPLAGCISFYGAGVVNSREGIGLTPFIEDFSSIKCPVLLFYGEDDQSIPLEDRTEIEKSLKKNGKEYEIHVFRNSEHGFFCDERKSYNPKSASESWQKTLSFLDRRIARPSSV